MCQKIVQNILIFVYLFFPKYSTIDSKKISITQEHLVVEGCPTPPWTTFLMLHRLVYNLRSYLMMNCFCGMVDRQKAFSLISNRDHCQRSSISRNSDALRAGFKLAQNLSSSFVKLSCAVVITTTPRRHFNDLILAWSGWEGLRGILTSLGSSWVYTNTLSSLPSIIPGTQRLTCLLGAQGKYVLLIVRQLPIKAGWWNALLTLQDLADAICLNKARNTKNAFSALNKTICSVRPPPTDNKAAQTTNITKLGPLSLPHLAFNRTFTISELKNQFRLHGWE